MQNECRAALKYIVDLHAKQRNQVYAAHVAQRETLASEVVAQLSGSRYALLDGTVTWHTGFCRRRRRLRCQHMTEQIDHPVEVGERDSFCVCAVGCSVVGRCSVRVSN